jgi:2-polyprenyl-6-methoxyphenol hydroxylase-like FAD-dependent oxidoreductase
MFVSSWLPSTSIAGTRPGSEGRDYLVWAYAARAESYGMNVESCGGEGLRDLVLSRISHWSPSLHSLVEGSDCASIKPIRLRTMPVLPEWPSSRVTLLGDAIHNMTPMAGIGANTALRDSAVLGEALGQAVDSKDVPSAVASYESQIRAHANKALSLSRLNAERATSGAGVPRRGCRAALRVAQVFPVVKRRLFRQGDFPRAVSM